MLHIQIQPESFLVLEKIFEVFLSYIGMAAILFFLFIQINYQYPFDRMPHVKYGENCSSGFREKAIKITHFYTCTIDSRYLDFAYLEVKIWSLFCHGNPVIGNKILRKKGETAPKKQFLLFSKIVSIYL